MKMQVQILCKKSFTNAICSAKCSGAVSLRVEEQHLCFEDVIQCANPYDRSL